MPLGNSHQESLLKGHIELCVAKLYIDFWLVFQKQFHHVKERKRKEERETNIWTLKVGSHGK